MVHIAIDTCVWLELLKAAHHTDDNLFDELLFWINSGDLVCITNRNIVIELDRNCIGKKESIVSELRKVETQRQQYFIGNQVLNDFYKPDAYSAMVDKRILQIKEILRTKAEIFEDTDQIKLEAANRSINLLAPCHKKDSFRDALNILSILSYNKQKGYQDTIFTTVNYKDYSVNDSKSKHNIHPDLDRAFNEASLKYIYFDVEHTNFGKPLYNTLRKILPNYQDFLKAQHKKEQEERLLREKMEMSDERVDSTDPDFIDNIQYIDLITTRKSPSSVDKIILESLFKRHESYKSYFMKKVMPL